MKKLIERHSFLMLLLVVMAGSFCFAYYVWAQNPGTDFTLCTSTVDQPECYDTEYPTPTVNWTVSGSSSQTQYEVEIDQNLNFNNLEIDTGAVTSGANSYTVDQDVLIFGHTYYWRVKIKDNYDSWSNWAEADSSFTASNACSDPPTATSLSVSSGDSSTYCGGASHYFSWTYSDPEGDEEERFQFQVDNNSDFSSPEVDRDYEDLSNPSPTTNSQTVSVVESPGSDQIGYNTTYYWRVKVYDQYSADSGWVNGSSFTTETHRYPTISFSWDPTEPNQDEDVDFTDESTVYGGATKSSWAWTFEDGNPSSSTDQNPTIQFTNGGQKDVVLSVTDSSGFTCDNSASPEVIDIEFPIPDWREVLP